MVGAGDERDAHTHDDRAQTVLVYRRSAPDAPAFDVALELTEGDTLASPQLPGFALAVSELFADFRD